MEIEEEVDKLKAKIEQLETAIKMTPGNIYDWTDGDRRVIWVLTNITNEGQLEGFTLHDSLEGSSESHLVHWGRYVFDQKKLTTAMADELLLNLLEAKVN